MTTSLLITDYSSVFFDVAYMNKPIVFYHFDYDEFRQKHLSEGYFSYEKDGMGPIAHDEKELIDLILDSYSDQGFYTKDRYVERTKRFFPLQDADNCQRIYDEIKSVEKNG
jgi:CDP-glycerol glycerophosphotransferase (TagB/SpsB family)